MVQLKAAKQPGMDCYLCSSQTESGAHGWNFWFLQNQILGMGSASERWHYVTSDLIGWNQTQTDLCIMQL